MSHRQQDRTVGVCNTANFGIDQIQSKHRASIADTDTCHKKKNIHLNDQQQNNFLQYQC